MEGELTAMATSDERREVARKLRREGCALTALDMGMELASLTLDDAIGIEHNVTWEECFNRLADLIDPTCSVVRKQAYTGGPQMYKTLWCCSECGYPLAESKYKGHRPFVGENFCPRCGARVTGGGER